MKHIFKILFLTFFVSNIIVAQQVTWQRYYDVNNSPDSGLDVLQTFDGGYAFCGYGGGSLLLMKVNNLGIPEWQRVIPDSNSTYRAYSMQQTNDSGFIITGDVRNDSMLLLKTDKNGIQQWHKTFTNPNGLSRGYSIKITNDNGYIICGDIFYFSPPGIKAYVVKTDSVGNLQWSMEYDSIFSSDIIQTSDNNYYFVGGASIKKINSVGTLLWDKNLGSSIIGATFFGVGDIVQDSSNTFFISGGIAISGGYPFNMYLGKTDTSGNVVWENYYYPNSSCSDISRTNNGDVVMVGSALSDSINPEVNVAIVKVDQTGKEVFSKRVNSTTNVDGSGYAIKVTSDNGYIISGLTEYAGTSSNTNVLGIKTDSLGNTTSIVNIYDNSSTISKNFILYQNYPNPFNPTSILEFEISENGPPRRIVSLKVYNALGMEVADLVNEKKSAGRYSVSFDGSNLPSGVYFYKLSVTGGGRDFTETKRMVLLK